MTDIAKCVLCGEPMPPGEEMFKFHGYSGNCPKPPLLPQDSRRFRLGDHVLKVRGAQWQGTVVGFYSTKFTPEGYCVESDAHAGSVQIYPADALEIDPL